MLLRTGALITRGRGPLMLLLLLQPVGTGGEGGYQGQLLCPLLGTPRM